MTGNQAYVLSKKYTNNVALEGVPINYPIIDPVTNHWMLWNVSAGAYIDSGVIATSFPPRIGDNGNWEITQDGINWVDTGVPAGGKGVQEIEL